MMTPDQRRRLAILAGACSLEAPIKRNPNSYSVKVPWKLIEKIRAIQDEIGFDWKAEAEKVQRRHYHDAWRNLAPILRGKEPPRPDDYEPPLDTPSLDTSFHDHEMDVD